MKLSYPKTLKAVLANGLIFIIILAVLAPAGWFVNNYLALVEPESAEQVARIVVSKYRPEIDVEDLELISREQIGQVNFSDIHRFVFAGPPRDEGPFVVEIGGFLGLGWQEKSFRVEEE
jgi:hypothetical protein